ncbi:MAG: DUF4347 domain-containing protein, partial [Pyrinomonadaceae bacterium]
MNKHVKWGKGPGGNVTPFPSSSLPSFLKSSISYRVLEARTAFDAAAVATAADVAHDSSATADTAAAAEASSRETAAAESSSDLASAADTIAPSAGAGSNSVVFIDGSVADQNALISQIESGAEIVLLDSTRDGVEQMAEYLKDRSGIESIHILSHGDAGRLYVGNAVLDSKSMSGAYADDLGIIGAALSENADILIYGCDVASGPGGADFVKSLSDMTGADVAASSDDTGAAIYFQGKIGMRGINPRQAREAIDWHCRQQPKHAVRDYLHNLKWDKTERIEKAFETYWG